MKNFFLKNINKWAKENYVQIGILNSILLLLVLLRSAGYFAPFFPITINFIVLVSIILSAYLFNVHSRVIFVVGLLFWLFASVLKLLKIDIWAERTAIYSYQSLLIGVAMMIFENIKKYKD